MSTRPAIAAGIYRHYKGKLYQVLGMGHDADDELRTVVIYIGLELDDAHEGPRMAVRSADTWYDWMPNPADGGDTEIHRFIFLGPYYEKGMKA